MTVDQAPSPNAAQRVPVVVNGAGPVGVTAALLLARRGVRGVVVERHRGVCPLPRAVATDDEAGRILRTAGVGEEFAAIARPADTAAWAHLPHTTGGPRPSPRTVEKSLPRSAAR